VAAVAGRIRRHAGELLVTGKDLEESLPSQVFGAEVEEGADLGRRRDQRGRWHLHRRDPRKTGSEDLPRVIVGVPVSGQTLDEAVIEIESIEAHARFVGRNRQMARRPSGGAPVFVLEGRLSSVFSTPAREVA